MKKEEIERLFPIETDRLVVRIATLDDVDLIQTAKESRAADVLRRWMSWSSEEGMSVQGTINYLTMTSDAANRRNIALLGVDKTTGAHVLSTGLDADDDDFQVVSTGWWVSEGHEGKGLAFEAMRALLDILAVHAKAAVVKTERYEGNERSGNLMHRLGFQYVETQPKAHQCHLDGQFYDVLSYRLELS